MCNYALKLLWHEQRVPLSMKFCQFDVAWSCPFSIQLTLVGFIGCMVFACYLMTLSPQMTGLQMVFLTNLTILTAANQKSVSVVLTD